jgi:hypothetical protein
LAFPADDVGADADDNRQPVIHDLGIERNSDQLPAADEHVVRPFEIVSERLRSGAQGSLDAHLLQRRCDGQPGGETERRGGRRRNAEDLEDAGGEIAARRDPGALATSPSRRLHRRHEPDRSAIARATAFHRLDIGRADLVESFEPVTGGCGARSERECHDVLRMILSENRPPLFGIMRT